MKILRFYLRAELQISERPSSPSPTSAIVAAGEPVTEWEPIPCGQRPGLAKASRSNVVPLRGRRVA